MSSPVTLRRVLKFRTVVSTSAGLAYAAISFLGCVQLAWYLAGDSAWVAILVSGLLAVLAALCFSELNALYPTAAAIRLYMREAFSDNFSLIITFGILAILASLITGSSGLMTGTPLIVTIIIFALSTLYVYLGVPRIRTAAAARRATTARKSSTKYSE